MRHSRAFAILCAVAAGLGCKHPEAPPAAPAPPVSRSPAAPPAAPTASATIHARAAPARPGLRLVPPSWSTPKTGEGCHFVGNGTSLALSFDPSSPRADFASVTSYEDGEVQFGGTPEAAAGVTLTAGPFVFTTAARVSKVALYPQRPVLLYGVFEPFDSTPLEPEVQSDSAIVAYPSSWRTGTGPKLLSPRPSTLRCQDLGLTPTTFAPTPEPKGASLGVDVGSFRLRATPGGPAVLELPPDSTVSVSRYNAHVARVEYRTSEGIYRGFEAMSRLSPGSGGTSGSRVRARAARPTTTPCQESPTLYLVHTDDRVMEVGKIKPGRAFRYEGTPFTITTPSGGRSLVQVTSEWIEMASGFSLAVDAPKPDSCLPLPGSTGSARTVDAPSSR